MANNENPVAIFWFRRDLRLEDNAGLNEALKCGITVVPVFIFDTSIIDELNPDDARITFIYDILSNINTSLNGHESSLMVIKGNPHEVFEKLLEKYNVRKLFLNSDYEPYAIDRDKKIRDLFESRGLEVHSYKDQVIFGPTEILKDNGQPYTVYTPYKNKWLRNYNDARPKESVAGKLDSLHKNKLYLPTLAELGFERSDIKVRDYDLSKVEQYAETRNFPHLDATSYLSPHLRFGTISPRKVISQLPQNHDSFLNELVWREFFMQILFHYPKVVNHNFREKYDGITWRNNEEEFNKWCRGETGYPMVDAGMRQLNTSGYMHNRVRMVTASFLCKHLLIDWRLGESYFAGKLLDFELSSNNGNWQWAAGTGCDAAPYFRVFNPNEQLRKFDKKHEYVSKWIPEFGSDNYPEPMVDHPFARQRALDVYKKGIDSWKHI